MRARCEAAALSQGSFGLRGLYGDDGGECKGGSVVVSFWWLGRWLGRWLGAVVVECGWGGLVVGSIVVVWWCVCGGAAARMSQEEARATVGAIVYSVPRPRIQPTARPRIAPKVPLRGPAWLKSPCSKSHFPPVQGTPDLGLSPVEHWG
eukprot:scaffold35420_cov64-Phaeocystis_antarctica.AAC.1